MPTWLVVGGGFAGIALISAAAEACPGVDLVLVDPKDYFFDVTRLPASLSGLQNNLLVLYSKLRHPNCCHLQGVCTNFDENRVTLSLIDKNGNIVPEKIHILVKLVNGVNSSTLIKLRAEENLQAERLRTESNSSEILESLRRTGVERVILAYGSLKGSFRISHHSVSNLSFILMARRISHMRDFVMSDRCKRAIVIGGGPTAQQVAGNLLTQSVEVHMILRGHSLQPIRDGLDPSTSAAIEVDILRQWSKKKFTVWRESVLTSETIAALTKVVKENLPIPYFLRLEEKETRTIRIVSNVTDKLSQFDDVDLIVFAFPYDQTGLGDITAKKSEPNFCLPHPLERYSILGDARESDDPRMAYVAMEQGVRMARQLSQWQSRISNPTVNKRVDQIVVDGCDIPPGKLELPQPEEMNLSPFDAQIVDMGEGFGYSYLPCNKIISRTGRIWFSSRVTSVLSSIKESRKLSFIHSAFKTDRQL